MVVVVFDGCQALDAVGPVEVFSKAVANAPGGRPPYEIVLASPFGGDVTTNSGLVLSRTRRLCDLGPGTDTILVTGGQRVALEAMIDRSPLVEWVQARALEDVRLGAVCTGAFVLAAAGLLAGRRVTTHWSACARLQAFCPEAHVVPDAIFVADAPVFTSGGVSAAIDLALALVEADVGRDVALAVARNLVIFLRRPGGQSQFSAGLAAQAQATDRLRDLIAWMTDNPAEDLSVPSLARRTSMSERNFSRVFRTETGRTPAGFAELVRLDRAKSLLEDTDWPTARIAERAGLGSADTLQRAFRKHLGVTPEEYRSRFARTLGRGMGAQAR